jgi:hypothetical protein
MQLRPVEYLPDNTIERAALDLLAEHEQRWGTIADLPIPIEDVIERTLELQITWIEIEEQLGETILARLDPDFHGVPTIQMNERRLTGHFETYFGTEQYSLAHEVGHWVLHYLRERRAATKQQVLPGLESAVGAPVLCRRMDDSDRREWQAERFASYLLLPAHLLDGVVHGHDLSSRHVLADLAHQCGVSKKAFTRRLVDLKKIPNPGQFALWRTDKTP